MTDKDGNLLWFGNYTGWVRLKEETKVADSAYQPFRLQNQYCDEETRLHHNLMRYCEPEVGRFVNQDPIGLNGSINFYTFSFNITKWIDPFGWSCDEDNVKKVKELARNLSPKFKQRFKCEEFADALQKEMEKEGIQWRKSKS